MEVVEEENPLKIVSHTQTKDESRYKNSVGRPTKKKEILFSPPPKSIISMLLSKQKGEECQIVDQDKNSAMKEKTAKVSKKWTCSQCTDGIFYKKIEYKKHLLKHRVYKCDHPNCDYSTKFTSNLNTHKRIHTSEYLYVCDECTFRTKFINSLKTHKRLHQIDRPFGCQHCTYKCNSVSNLKKHCIRKHPNIPKE